MLKNVMGDIDELIGEIKAAGAWVFDGGLQPPSVASVLRVKDGRVLTTDGPRARSTSAAFS
ncbi:MAG: YciI family protein [Candidatus Dormibacteraceae bacterium]